MFKRNKTPTFVVISLFQVLLFRGNIYLFLDSFFIHFLLQFLLFFNFFKQKTENNANKTKYWQNAILHNMKQLTIDCGNSLFENSLFSFSFHFRPINLKPLKSIWILLFFVEFAFCSFLSFVVQFQYKNRRQIHYYYAFF